MSTIRVAFPGGSGEGFGAEVKRRVTDYFEGRGVSDKANAVMVLKTITAFALMLGPYLAILIVQPAPGVMLALAVLMGVGMAGVGFCVAHDALHGAYSSRPWVNRVLGLSFDLMGANGYIWKITHNIVHHTYTNIEGVDEDLSVSPLVRLSPSGPHWRLHRWQHLYAWVAYAFATIYWVFIKDYKYFLKRDIGPYRDKRHPPSAWATLFVTKALYYTWTIVIPVLVLDLAWWQFLIGFFAVHLTAGLILGVVFQLAHVVEGTDYPAPDEQGRMEDAWVIHEMRTTANFARANPLVNWYVGGLNFQVEHHLFPKVCSVHYPAITGIVEEIAQKHGVPYHAHPTLRAAIRSHYRMLRMLGRPDEEAVPARATAA